ncbi:hypothetical protein PZ938_11015 [Luteipulveratus sp. YIM 133132]|uniref:DUF6891 domain-containing protein n=1 Tax=Luteipulveratus flavus TaxID=3031728 RepID=A0ABT6C9N6_9MICO|nr:MULTISPECIES: hypothetical protein [unclassified Luteipulveratus]MDE9366136.1 hypothetical protein [Luteipulveratus sp. YIM 133132]MDF8265228.1 hypothetical protein [Luteipulveratus sp. YIM 133296]
MDVKPSRGRYFGGTFPPDTVTFAGAIALKVATGVDTREALVAGFSEIGAEMSSYFPEPAMDGADVERLVDLVIRDHNAQVTSASRDAIALLDAFHAMSIRGIVYSFAEAGDTQTALEDIGDSARELVEHGVGVRGYCFAHAVDTDELIMNGQLALGYGIFAESGSMPEEIGRDIAQVLREHGLTVRPHLSAEQRLIVGPMVYELPYEGMDIPAPDEEL